MVGWTEWMARCKFWEGWFFQSLKFIAFTLGLDHKTHWRPSLCINLEPVLCHLDLFADRPTAQVHRLRDVALIPSGRATLHKPDLPLRSQSRSNVPPSLGFVPKAVSKMLGRETLRPVFSTDNSPPLPSAMAASSGLRVSSAASFNVVSGEALSKVQKRTRVLQLPVYQ